MFGTILRSVGGKTSMACGYYEVKQAGLAVSSGKISRPDAWHNISDKWWHNKQALRSVGCTTSRPNARNTTAVSWW